MTERLSLVTDANPHSVDKDYHTREVSVLSDGTIQFCNALTHENCWTLDRDQSRAVASAVWRSAFDRSSCAKETSRSFAVVLDKHFDVMFAVENGLLGACPADADFGELFAPLGLSRMLAISVLRQQVRMLSSFAQEECNALLSRVAELLKAGTCG